MFAVISQLPASFLFNPSFSGLYLDIFFTLAFGLLAIRFFDRANHKFLAVIPILFLAFVSEFFGFDFGAIGVLMVLFFYVFRNKKNLMVCVEAFLMFVFFMVRLSLYDVLSASVIRYILLQLLFMVCSLIFIVLYNGKRGIDNRFIQIGFYLFYPIHLFFLCMVKYFLV